METVLVVAAHPDDEVLGCGGTLARHAAAGDAVHVLFLADGVAARTAGGSVDPGALTARLDAAREAAAILGLAGVDALGLPDNRLDTVPLLDLVQAVERVLARLDPQIVYTHHHGDLNIDHRLAHQAVLTACRPLPGCSVHTLRCFEVPSSTEWQAPGAAPFEPNLFIDVTATLDRKRRALQAYGAELRTFPHPRSIEAIEALGRWRGASAGLAHAEAFVVARQIVAG
ncbi:MAG: PIG-L family deacetylase [Rhodocyclaceae bacterium]|nr:PIG-L family deacetylase [Rhodocyclaceae bacterium]